MFKILSYNESFNLILFDFCEQKYFYYESETFLRGIFSELWETRICFNPLISYKLILFILLIYPINRIASYIQLTCLISSFVHMHVSQYYVALKSQGNCCSKILSALTTLLRKQNENLIFHRQHCS